MTYARDDSAGRPRRSGGRLARERRALERMACIGCTKPDDGVRRVETAELRARYGGWNQLGLRPVRVIRDLDALPDSDGRGVLRADGSILDWTGCARFVEIDVEGVVTDVDRETFIARAREIVIKLSQETE